MKTSYLPFVLFLMIPFFGNAQNGQCAISNAVPFISVNTNTHYRGLAEIGTITSGNGQAFLPWKENPALLSQANAAFAVKSNVLKSYSFSNYSPMYYNVNGYTRFSDRLTVGLDATAYTLGKITFTDINGEDIKDVRPVEYVLTGALGLRLNDHFSLGMGLRFFESGLLSDLSLSQQGPELKNIRSAAVNLGVHYQGEKQFSETVKVTFEGGLSILNFGPKVSYIGGSGVGDNFLPSSLELGGRIGWQAEWREGQSFGINLLVQLDHSLQSACWFVDDNQNGIADHLELDVWTAAFQSFGDDKDGFRGQWRSMTKRIALHPWIALNADWKAGLGIGYFGASANIRPSQHYSLGFHTSFKNVQLEVSNTRFVGSLQNITEPNSTWSFSFGYAKLLSST